jgi:hypothetical protein
VIRQREIQYREEERVMPPFVLAPLVKWTFAVCGGAAIVHWMVKEMRRLNEELDQVRAAPVDAVVRERLPTLRRDPHTGEWRVMR